MNKKSLTLTVLIDAHANYGEGLGNISTVQKITKNNKQYAIRTKESLKNSIMTNSGFYDSLNTTVDGATQKMVSEDNTIENDRSLEGGYMTTKPKTFKRNSSFSISDAISINPFSIETRFCNNLGMATNYAKANNINVNDDAKKAGLMPYQFEVDAEYKLYSITIDLEAIGIDENFNINTDTEEKIDRVNYLVDTVQHLSLLCKGFLDNAEPLFIIGGLSKWKYPLFNNVVIFKDGKLKITESLMEKIEENDAHVGIIEGIFENEDEIKEKLNAVTINKFFKNLKEEIYKNYME